MVQGPWLKKSHKRADDYDYHLFITYLLTYYYLLLLLSYCTTKLYILMYAVFNYSRVIVLKFRDPHLRKHGINMKVLMPTSCLQLGVKGLNESI